MPKKNLILVLAILISLFTTLTLLKAKPTYSLTNHVVISEIQISGTTATDEFIELYNPTENDINISGWRLTRKTSGGTEGNLIASISGTIKSHGYFLIAHPNYDGNIPADNQYSAPSNSIANDATILLYSDAGKTLVDKVGIGTSIDPETASTFNPGVNLSIERKARSTSTSESMAIGGEDEFLGNAQDTENNANDFVLRNSPQPQNSNSLAELPPTELPTIIPSETPSISPTAIPSPTVTTSPTPSEEPIFSPSPTIEPTPITNPTPTEFQSPTPSFNPSPTQTPTPTEIPSPTPTQSLSPTPKIIGRFDFHNKHILCTLNFELKRVGFLNVFFPKINCLKVNQTNL